MISLEFPESLRPGDDKMKITINIDCTPAEARAFMGLPDFEPMQKRAMEQLEKQMMDQLERYTPEMLLKSWMTPGALNGEWFGEILKQAAKK
jgi:hypothetical protein